jgi:isoleucyl-tRNA synthetase
MSEAAKAIQELDPSAVAAAFDRGESVQITVGGRSEPLGADDLVLAMLPRPGYKLEREANYAVALKLELDEELRREGVAREVVHAIQNARKGAGLDVEDRIELALSGADGVLEAVRAHADYVTGETLATRLELDGAADRSGAAAGTHGAGAHTETARIEGADLTITLNRADS